jgi:hypothetical protein
LKDLIHRRGAEALRNCEETRCFSAALRLCGEEEGRRE